MKMTSPVSTFALGLLLIYVVERVNIRLCRTCVFSSTPMHLHGDQHYADWVRKQNTLGVPKFNSKSVTSQIQFSSIDLSEMFQLVTIRFLPPKLQDLSPRGSSVGVSASCAQPGAAKPNGKESLVPESWPLLLRAVGLLQVCILDGLDRSTGNPHPKPMRT